jgi:hypothetical protein
MKKVIIIIVLSLFLSNLPLNLVKAEVNFSDIEVYEMKNGGAKLKWRTDSATKAEIFYGLDQDNLDRFMGYSIYTYPHETFLSGLENDQTYYFKIKAIEESGETTESLIQTFSTEDMEDTIRPEFGDYEFLQVTDDAVALLWYTDEDTEAIIYYGQNSNDLSETTTYTTSRTRHIKLIYNLYPSTRYYFKIKAIDEDENYREKTVQATTRSSKDYTLEISNIRPTTVNDELITPTGASIRWENNLVSKGLLYYGSKVNKINNRLYSDNYFDREHQVGISGLKPDTTYYYKVKSYQSLYDESETSSIMSFKTKSLDESYPIGTLVKGSGPEVYALREGMEKIWIKNEEVFNGLNYRWNMIKNVSEDYLDMYETTITVDDASRHPSGSLVKYQGNSTVFMIYYGEKRPFFTAQALERRGYSWDDIITLPDDRTYPTGDEVF